MSKSLFFTFFFLVIITSCSPIKKLSVADYRTMNRFLQERSINNAKQLLVNDYKTYKKLSKQDFLTIPKVLFFNKDGFSIDYLDDTKHCSQEPLKFINEFNKDQVYAINKNLKLDEFISSFHAIDANSIFNKSENTELYVFINWGSFAKKINDDSLNLLKNQRKGIDFYLINIEPQQNWNLTDEQIKQIKM